MRRPVTVANPPAAAGFSLIELMVVVCMLGLLAGAVFVGVDATVPSFRIESAARKLASAIAGVRAEAAMSGRPAGIVYDLEKGSYSLLVPPEIANPEDAKPIDASDLEETSPTQLGRGIIIEDVAFGERKVFRSKVKVIFGPSEFAPPHLVHLACGDLRYTVEVNTVTGIVDVSEGEGKFDLLLSEEKFERK